MNVDDLVFVTPHEVRGENLHETREDDEVGLVFLEELEGAGLGGVAFEPRDVGEGELVAARDGFEIGVIREDEDGFGAGELVGAMRGEEGLEAMGFARDENGQALAAMRFGETNFDFHREAAREGLKAGNHGVAAEVASAPRSLEGHAELAAGDLFLEALDVRLLLEEKTGYAGNDAGLVAADHSERGEMFHAPRTVAELGRGSRIKTLAGGNVE